LSVDRKTCLGALPWTLHSCAMVVVTVSSIQGAVLLGPENFHDSTSVGDLKAKLLCLLFSPTQRAEPNCFVRLVADCQAPHDSVTLQKLTGCEETLQLTAIFEYKSTSKKRQDYIKEFANHDAQAREIFKQMPLVAHSDDAVVMAMQKFLDFVETAFENPWMSIAVGDTA